MTLTALLTAIAIFIPIAMPLKLVIPPASYTLGSHVAIFIAMFINPWMAIFVVLGSSYGFFISGAYPLVIVFRALSHILFATLGAFFLQKHPKTLENRKASWIFNFVLALIHRFRDRSSKHVLRPLCLSRIWYSDSQYGRL